MMGRIGGYMKTALIVIAAAAIAIAGILPAGELRYARCRPALVRVVLPAHWIVRR